MDTKLRTTHMLRQTRNNWIIRHQQYRYTQSTINNWRLEWKQHEQQLTKILHPNINTSNSETYELIQTHPQKYTRGQDLKRTTLQKLLKIRKKYGGELEPQQLEPNEHEAIARIMLHTPHERQSMENKT